MSMMLTGQVILELIVILIVVQLFGYACRRIGMPWVIGEILAGIALGSSLLGAVVPHVYAVIFPLASLPTLQTLGDIGLVFYMFTLGSHLDTQEMVHQSRKALIVSLSSILLPLTMGALLALTLYSQFAGPRANLVPFVLLIGSAMAITAFPVLARMLTETNLLDTEIGTLALTCAAFNDVIAWCLLAVVIALAQARSLASGAVTVGLALLYTVVMFVLVRPLLAYASEHLPWPQLLVTLMIILLLLSAGVTDAIGIHPVFGAFVMGIILPRDSELLEQVHGSDKLNDLLFLPLFFVSSGLRTQLGLISSPSLWLICLLVIVIACLGKMLGSTLSVHWLGEPWRESLTLGVLMNTRGLVELILLNIGLDLGVLSPALFAILVVMAIVATMMAPPLLRVLGIRQHRRAQYLTELPASVGSLFRAQLRPK